jgi:hypothetical protein
VVPGGKGPGLEYLNGATPPIGFAYVPHTVTHPASTGQLTVQVPPPERYWAMLIEPPVLALPPAESDTWTPKEKPPAAVGVPETVPPVDRVRPPGNAPELTAQE